MEQEQEKPNRVKKARVKSLDGGAKAAKTRKPELKEVVRARWQDPVLREKMLSRNAEARAARKAAGKPINTSRANIPDGMRRDQAKRFWRQARFEASLTMRKLAKAGVIDENTPAEAQEALHAALAVMRSPMDQKTTLAAARLVLDFTKAKPASKSEVTINTAEEWLSHVTRDNEQGTDEEDAGDAQASA
jgi:hypothetical protein